MINRPAIVDWEKQVPWPENQQIEQDLLLSRAIVEIFSDERLSKTLLFRGGTALYKLHVKEPIRYSEDLDFVMIDKGPIGPIYDAIREKLDPLMGEPSRDQKESMAIMEYTYEAEFPPQGKEHLKLEINYEEDFTVLDPIERDFQMENPWFSGEVRVPTFQIDELMASKLRALFQRRKGRDLFDIWYALTRELIKPDQVLTCFENYTESLDTPITRARFEKNLTAKADDRLFVGDLEPLISREYDYDVRDAMDLIHDELIQDIPGDPYQGDDNYFIEKKN